VQWGGDAVEADPQWQGRRPGRRGTPARLRRALLCKKNNDIRAKLKISAEPPQRGEVSKTCKKNVRLDGRQPHMHVHSIQHFLGGICI